MRVIRAQFKVKKEGLADFEAARERILSALSRDRPDGVRYIWCKLPSSTTFVGWLELDDGVENPLPSIAAGKAFQENVKNWVVEPPVREELEVIGSYKPTHNG